MSTTEPCTPEEFWDDEVRDAAGRARAPAPFATGLDELADEVWAWHLRELGEGTTIGKAAKVAEEAGELVGHVIKSTEPRPDALEHWNAARLEVADVILATLGAARALGFGSIEEILRYKWSVVRLRRFATAESTVAQTLRDCGVDEIDLPDAIRGALALAGCTEANEDDVDALLGNEVSFTPRTDGDPD